MSTEIIGRKSITGTKQSWVHIYYLHVHWIMEIPLMDSVADKSSELSLDTHWPENDLLWYFHNQWCRLIGHEMNRQLPKPLVFCEKYHSKKLHNPSSKCDNPNDICTYWIENEHHCLIKFDTRNVPEICRRQNNWNQCPTWPRSHQDLSPEKFPPFLSILLRKKKNKKKPITIGAKMLWNLFEISLFIRRH